MPNYVFWCDHCGDITEANYRFVDRPEEHPCNICGKPAEYRIAAPNIMTAAYPDGTRRFSDMKEAAKLQKEAANSRADKKKEIAAEIRKMGVRLSKGDGI